LTTIIGREPPRRLRKQPALMTGSGVGDRVMAGRRIAAGRLLAAALVVALAGCGDSSKKVGQVSTNFRWLGPNDRIVVDVFHDPKLDGVVCYLSRPERGGVSGALGVAENVADVAIACRQVGPIVVKETIKPGEKVFDERRSLIFKTLQVVRFFDTGTNALVYVAYTDKVLTGSPEHSLSAVPLAPWGTEEARWLVPRP
jgi:CreA protein